jgi:hypothetical protein
MRLRQPWAARALGIARRPFSWSVDDVDVAFFKIDEGRLCQWTARPRKRKPFVGSTMASGRDLPHDLAHFVVEEAVGLECGFWGLLAKGASFASVAARRPTRPGRELIRAHRAELAHAEDVVNAHLKAWRSGSRTPVAPALDRMLARWRALKMGEGLDVVWRSRLARR